MTTQADLADRSAPVPPPEQQGVARVVPPIRPALSPETALPPTAGAWVRSQAVNVSRHAAALRPFRDGEFGTGSAAPTRGHVAAVNRMLRAMGEHLDAQSADVGAAARQTLARPGVHGLRETIRRAESAHRTVRAIEQVWDWYFEFFGQRQSRFGDWLLACDRIALDIYQDAYMGLGLARSIPAPPPMTYLRTGLSPATFRRSIPLRRLGLLPNPFPIVQLPYHRLVNPWTLGAILHEISHNLQNELGLARAVPEALGRRLSAAGTPAPVVRTWVRWNRETFADLFALLLGGPAVVGSLVDILARSPSDVTTFNPRGVHPMPLLRTRISTELLRRMGFEREAGEYRRMWDAAYADVVPAAPEALLRTAPEVTALVVDTICYTPFAALGDRPLSGVFAFDGRHQAMVAEAGRRLARGTDPGVVPERFLIGAARFALDRRLAPPATIAANFFRDLARR